MKPEKRLEKLKEIINKHYSPRNNADFAYFDKNCLSILNHELENFFANSDVRKLFQSNADNPDDLAIDYDGRSYVRMMKLFSPNFYTRVNYKSCYNGEALDKVINETPFYLRFYMPKNVIGTIGKKISRLVIMFNGMNEILNFELYDILGEFFASENIAAVLLPTPLHLNRRLRENSFEPNSPQKDAIIPSKWVREKNSYSLFYLNYIKSYLELGYLIQMLKGQTPSNFGRSNSGHNDSDFYNSYFDKDNIKITLLGYSLGGLKALGYFLMDFNPIQKSKTKTVQEYELFESKIKEFKESSVIDSCITINSGPNLLKVNSQKQITAMDQGDWKVMLEELKKTLIAGSEINKDHEDLLKMFSFLYYVGDPENQDDEANAFGREKLKSAIDNYLAISGGVDNLVSTDLIQKIFHEEDGIKVNQLIVAKGDHHPSSDSSGWHEMLPIAERNILDLISSCEEKHYTKTAIIDIMEEIMGFSSEFEFIKSNCQEKFHNHHMEKLITGFGFDSAGDEYKRLFKKYYFRSKAFYPNFPEVIQEFVKRDGDRKKFSK